MKHLKGFSLLETVLALVIFVGAMSVVGQMIELGVRSSLEARRLTEATILCESQMGQILVGAAPLDNVSGEEFEDDPDWRWSLEVARAPVDGLLTITVTVSRTGEQTGVAPVSSSLTRWIRDPDYWAEMATQWEKAQEEATASQGTSSDSSQGSR